MNRRPCKQRYAIVTSDIDRPSSGQTLIVEHDISLDDLRERFDRLVTSLVPLHVRVLEIPNGAYVTHKFILSSEELESFGWRVVYDPRDGAFLTTRAMSSRERLASMQRKT